MHCQAAITFGMVVSQAVAGSHPCSTVCMQVSQTKMKSAHPCVSLSAVLHSTGYKGKVLPLKP